MSVLTVTLPMTSALMAKLAWIALTIALNVITMEPTIFAKNAKMASSSILPKQSVLTALSMAAMNVTQIYQDLFSAKHVPRVSRKALTS